MAYRVPLARNCQHPGCGRVATDEIRSSTGQIYGVYCAKHATDQITSLNEAERLAQKMIYTGSPGIYEARFQARHNESESIPA